MVRSHSRLGPGLLLSHSAFDRTANYTDDVLHAKLSNLVYGIKFLLFASFLLRAHVALAPQVWIHSPLGSREGGVDILREFCK